MEKIKKLLINFFKKLFEKDNKKAKENWIFLKKRNFNYEKRFLNDKEIKYIYYRDKQRQDKDKIEYFKIEKNKEILQRVEHYICNNVAKVESFKYGEDGTLIEKKVYGNNIIGEQITTYGEKKKLQDYITIFRIDDSLKSIYIFKDDLISEARYFKENGEDDIDRSFDNKEFKEAIEFYKNQTNNNKKIQEQKSQIKLMKEKTFEEVIEIIDQKQGEKLIKKIKEEERKKLIIRKKEELLKASIENDERNREKIKSHILNLLKQQREKKNVALI